MKIPTAIEKRNMLYSPDPRRPVDFVSIGDALFEKGRDCEALDFYERIPEGRPERVDRLEKTKRVALERGDAFLLSRLSAKGLVSKEEWARAAKTARAAGRPRYALKAFVAAGDEAQAAELRLELGIAVTAVTDAARPEDAQAGVRAPGGHVEAAIGLPVPAAAPEAAPPAPADPAEPAHREQAGDGPAPPV